jgi:hypothetical protein
MKVVAVVVTVISMQAFESAVQCQWILIQREWRFSCVPCNELFFCVAKRTSEVSFREQTNGFFLSPSKNLYFLVKRVPPLSRTSARRYYFSTLVGSLARSRVVRAMEFGLEVCAELMWILDGCLPKLKRFFVDLSDNGTERSFHRWDWSNPVDYSLSSVANPFCLYFE